MVIVIYNKYRAREEMSQGQMRAWHNCDHQVLLLGSFGGFWVVECHIARLLIPSFCSSTYRKAILQFEIHYSDLSLTKAQI